MRDKFYWGYIKEQDLIKESTSGGIAYSLYDYFLRENGVAYGVEWSDDFSKAQYTRIDDIKNIKKIQGTKYVRASVKMRDERNVYDAIIEDLQLGRSVIFIGLPCEVACLSGRVEKIGKSLKENLLCVDLICHGPVEGKVLKEYAKMLERRYKGKIKYLSLRYKNPDWGKSYVKAVFDNEKVFLEELHKTEFGIAFNIMGECGCYRCRFRGDEHKADLTIGDWWGAKKNYQQYNKNGMSLIISHNVEAEEWLKRIDIELGEINDRNKALEGNPYYYEQRVEDKRRDKFVWIYNKFGLRVACMLTIGVKEFIIIYVPGLYRLIKKLKIIIKHR